MDILIYAKPEIVKHKMSDNNKLLDFCYWTGRIPADINMAKIDRIYFSDGKKIYAESIFYPTVTAVERKLCFSPLRKVSKKQPKKPPIRGWCYINKEV